MEIFRLNFYKRHLGDIAKSCSDLSQGQMGAYDLLLDWHYANEKPLPLSDDKLYRIARAVTQPERSNVDSVILELFTRTDAGYTHKRAAEEMSKASAQADTNRRIAEEREARRRATNEARSVHETLDEACTKRQPSQTPDSRLHKEQDQKQKGGKPPALTLPDWLPQSAWDDWHSFRNSSKGWTHKARELSLRTLTKLYAKGNDPTAVIENSIEKGWTGLFEIKSENNHANLQSIRKLSVVEQIETNIRDRREREGDCGDAALVLIGHG